MGPLSARDILHVWELGQARHTTDRALLLLAAGCPESTWEELSLLPIGRRDALLLALREQTLSAGLSAFARCLSCGEQVEFALATSDVRVASPHSSPETWEMVADDLTLRFRLPNSRDLALLAGSDDPETAGHQLAQHCLLHASRGGEVVELPAIPPAALPAVAVAMAERDPQAEILLELTCPACESAWEALLDIGAFFWTELQVEAKRLLFEVDALARAYGWSESEILDMSAFRRRCYLEVADR